MTRGRIALLALVGVVVAAGAVGLSRTDDLGPGEGVPTAPRSTESGRATARPSRLPRGKVTLAGVEEHLAAFADIARRHGGTRAAGTPGYRASAAYVAKRLEQAGYEVTTQSVAFTAFRERRPSQLLVGGRRAGRNSFTVMVFSGSGRARADVTEITGSSHGCSASDFEGFPPGDVALLSAAECKYVEQAANAQAGGAVAVAVAPRPHDAGIGPVRGMLHERSGVAIPVLGVTDQLGRRMARGPVQVRVDATAEPARAQNVIAHTASGRAGTVVMLGAHLDSAVGSPGVNDNGSGSAVILEVAEAMAEEDLRNRVTFAWWAAEEYGLLGSTHYVESLGGDRRAAIAAYLNFDMLGSPNFVRYLYEGDGEPAGSVALEEMFREWFDARNLPIEEIPLEGRSDHAPFASAGIPVGGLFTGANMLKTADEVEDFGGIPGIGEDRCYHLPCDDLDNVDRRVLRQMALAVGHAVHVLARSPGAIP